MKQVIYKNVENDVIDLNDVCFNNNIICYETNGGTGLGILVKRESKYGFDYHKDLVEARHNTLKYLSDNWKHSIRSAIFSGRKVLLFEDFDEFVEHAAKHSKL